MLKEVQFPTEDTTCEEDKRHKDLLRMTEESTGEKERERERERERETDRQRDRDRDRERKRERERERERGIVGETDLKLKFEPITGE